MGELGVIKDRYRCMVLKYLVQLDQAALVEASAIGEEAFEAGVELDEVIALHEVTLAQLGDAAKTRDRSAPLNEVLRVYAQAVQPDGRRAGGQAAAPLGQSPRSQPVMKAVDGSRGAFSGWKGAVSGGKGAFSGGNEVGVQRYQAGEQLAQTPAQELVGELAGGLGHDVNELLTVIKSFGALVSGELTEGSAAHRNMEQVMQAADQAENFTQQLVALSRLQPLRPQRIDVGSLIGEAGALLERRLGAEWGLTIEHGSDVPDVWMDADAFRQVLTILTVNARNSMSEGGRVLIRTDRITLASALSARCNVQVREGEHTRVRIRAGSVGPARAAPKNLSQPVSAPNPLGHDMRIGLSTVYALLKQAAGYVVAESTAEGFQFDVYLPVWHESASTAGDRSDDLVRKPAEGIAEDSSERAATRDCTVLLVEDEDRVRRPLVRYLDRQGYRVLQASNGKEAMKLCHDEDGAIDVLVTDVVMPEMGGGELAERIVQHVPTVKVIYISGYAVDMVTNRGIAGRDAVLMQKPFSLQELADTVRDVAAS